MIAATGWTWNYVRNELRLSEYFAIVKYWEKHPPLHLMVAAYLGGGEKEPELTWENEDIEMLFARFSAAQTGD